MKCVPVRLSARRRRGTRSPRQPRRANPRQPEAARSGSGPVPREVRGDEGKREEADVRGRNAPAGSASTGSRRGSDLDRHGRATAQPRATHIFRDSGRGRLGASVLVVARENELFPEALPNALGRTPASARRCPQRLRPQEGLVVESPSARAQRSAHEGDLQLAASWLVIVWLLRRWSAMPRSASRAGPPWDCVLRSRPWRQLQIFPSVLSTVCHWRRSSANWSPPASVIR